MALSHLHSCSDLTKTAHQAQRKAGPGGVMEGVVAASEAVMGKAYAVSALKQTSLFSPSFVNDISPANAGEENTSGKT